VFPVSEYAPAAGRQSVRHPQHFRPSAFREHSAAIAFRNIAGRGRFIPSADGITIEGMSFIDEGLASRADLSRRNALIAEHSPKIFTDLWERIAGYVVEAKEKGFELETSGSLYHRRVELLRKTPEKGRVFFQIDLNREPGAEHISTRGADVMKAFRFTLDLCPDGVVCLVFNGAPVQTEEIAVMLLRYFLFPDIYPPA
jgi:hypothetical protein